MHSDLFRNIWLVLRKELTDALRDRRTLVRLMLPAVLMGPLLLLAVVARAWPALGVALVNGTAGNTRNLTLAAAQSVLVTLAALGLDCPVAGPTFTFMIASGACIEWIRQR